MQQPNNTAMAANDLFTRLFDNDDLELRVKNRPAGSSSGQGFDVRFT